MKLTKKNFFTFLISLDFLFIVLYITVHLCSPENGAIQKSVQKEDISFLSGLDTAKKEQVIIHFLDSKYEFISPAYLKEQENLVKSVKPANYINIVSSVGVTSRSFFWLRGETAIVELFFWSLFGTLCSFLYYYSENEKRNDVKESEFVSYISKLCYAPFVTLIIYYVPGVFSPSNTFLSGNGQWIIVFAFILGFFSGRAIELLDRIKNLVFPYNQQHQEPNAEETPAPAAPQEIPASIYEEAIENKYAEWNALYGPLESVSTGYKRHDGTLSNIRCIHFDINVKKDVTSLSPARLIPSVINYLAKDGQIYHLPTDVNEVGPTTPDYDPNQPMSIGEKEHPKCLGISCSRNSSQAAGTIGLRVAKTTALTIPYLLSCYHVLGAPEMAAGKSRVDLPSDLIATAGVTSPAKSDSPVGATLNTLAEFSEGLIEDNMDAAIALLKAPLNNRIFRTVFSPDKRNILQLTPSHEKERYPIKMVGRTSGKQNGTVESYYTQITVQYNGLPQPTVFNGIIKTSKISNEGDSGAVVYDEHKNVIGILFASNNSFSYVIPIRRILSKLKLEII